MGSPTYIELHCHSAFSFLDGASHPEEPVARAAELGYPALALTDHDGVYGSLEFAYAAKHAGIRPITGAEVTIGDGGSTRGSGAGDSGRHVTLLCETGKGYANLCRILTEAHAGTRRPGREDREPLPPSVAVETVAELNEGLVCLSGCARDGLALHDPNGAARLARAFGRGRFFVELQRPYERGDARRHAALRHLAEHLGVETIATGNVHAHASRRALLQDVLVAIRCRTSLDGCERERRGNREAVLRSPEEMVERFAGIDRAAAERTTVLAERLAFDLTEELGYRYPDFSDRADPAIRQLAAICDHAFAERYGARDNVSRAKARSQTARSWTIAGSGPSEKSG
jgi:error-prone DNA polymerase